MSRLENNVVNRENRIERYKNPYFWIGLGGVVLTSLQVEATSLTSWANVGDLLIKTLSNPYLLGTTAMAILGVVVNPSTKGMAD